MTSEESRRTRAEAEPDDISVQAAGLRNGIAHESFGLDNEMICGVLRERCPSLARSSFPPKQEGTAP